MRVDFTVYYEKEETTNESWARNKYQEFKESLTWLDKGLKSLTAMLNKNNIGTIYFGVNDNGLLHNS